MKQAADFTRILCLYTDNIRKSRKFLEFCTLKNQYAKMNKIFEQYKVFERGAVIPRIDTGYKFVDILGTYLLEAASNNQYYLIYCRIGNMLERFERIDKVSDKKYLEALKRIPVFMFKFSDMLTDKRSLFSESMSPDEFMRQLAVYSIRHVKEEELPECGLDAYDIVKGLLDTVMKGENSGYIPEGAELIKLFGKLLHSDKNKLESICSDEFVSEIESLMAADFNEALGRLLLIQRITDEKGCYNLNRSQQGALVQNILHMNTTETESLLNIVNDDMKLFMQFVALKAYTQKRYTCFWNTQKDVYLYMCRQIYYIQQLYEKKAVSGDKGQKTRTYGCFGSLLKEMGEQVPSKEFQKKLKEKVELIEKKILMGESRLEIHPLETAVQGMIGRKSMTIQQLKYSFEGSVFKKVDGCRAEDFERTVLQRNKW